MKTITAMAALLALSAVGALAHNHQQVENSIRGRSGIVTVVVAKPVATTVALSRDGQGVGAKPQQNSAPLQHTNPSRGFNVVR